MPASVPSRSLHTLWAAAALLLLAAPAAADRDGSYGYFRVIEGSATVTQAGSGGRAAAELNQPVLAGDRLWVPRNGRLEVVLSDGNLLRVDGDTELLFERLADSPESNDRQTVLRLLDGNIQLVVRGGGEPPRVDTPNATVYVQDEGSYRIGTGDEEWTEVVVREGYAEVVTERGSAVVREDEQAWVDGVRDPRVDVQDADGRDGLERWAERLDDEYESGGDRYAYLDPDLRYQGSSLHRYGSWVNYNRSWVWRPRVALGWRPYHLGRWTYTPAGYFWITSEPWGWVPYHYGTWDYAPAYGWVWYPGRTFAPAWVYWYWGSSHIGWCPVGYYTNWYNRGWGGHGFRHGVYGWVGGHWGLYDDWSFVAYDHFRRRDLHRWARGGRDLHETRPGGLGRGILTTDTRSLTPDRLGDPRGVQEVLRRRDITPRRAAGGDLPDVTPFIERRNELPPEVMRRVAVERPGDAPEGSPLRPRIAIDRRDGGAAGAGEGRRVVGGDTPRAVPARPDTPATDSGGDAPRAVPARPARPPESDTAPEAWRVRRRDDGGSGAADAPRAVPERRSSPPESGGDTRRAAPEERRTPPADSGGESWRVRERDNSGARSDGEARESRPRAADREPPQRSYRSTAEPRQARPEIDAGREIRRAPRRDDSGPTIRSAPPSRPAPEARSRPTYRPSSPPAAPRSGGYSPAPRPSAPPRASSPPSSSGGGRSAAPRSRGSDSPPSSSSRQPRSRSRGDGDE